MKKLLIAILIFQMPLTGFAATSSTTNWEFQENATAGNLNGGGFDYGNANFDATLSATGGTGSTCTVSSSNYSFVSGDIGNWVYIKSGTNWYPGWYQIGSISGSSAVLNSAVGQAVVVNTANGGNSNYPYSYGVATVAGCASTATPSSGTWGLDYSQTTTAYKTDSTLASATGTTTPSTVTDVGLSFGVNTIGNQIHVTAGTSWTTGFYEIVSVSAGTATLDRAVGTAATLTSGTYYLGGALPVGALLSAFLNSTSGGPVGGDITWIKYNSTAYTLSASQTGSGTVCTAAAPCEFVGYNTYHGDNPTGTNRPTITSTSSGLTGGQYQDFYNFIVTSGGTTTLASGNGSRFINDKVINNSSTTTRIGLTVPSEGLAFSCEVISQMGYGISAGTFAHIVGSYIHDSNIGLYLNATADQSVDGNLFESNTADDIDFTYTGANGTYINHNDFYGNPTPSGTGILLAAGASNVHTFNNIFYGLATAVSGTTAIENNFLDYNDYYNNTTNYTLINPDPVSTTLNPNFSSVTQIAGTTATSSGSVLTDTSKTFTSALVGQYLHVLSGTGVTIGIYLITAETSTTLTTNNALGSSSAGNIVYFINTGHNFGITNASLYAQGYPGPFPAGLTTGYLDQGAVQHQSLGSSSNGYTY